MAISDELFLAILSMDAYNRGYNAGFSNIIDEDIGLDSNSGLGGVGSEIGDAVVVRQDNSEQAQSIGFYAVSYQWGGKSIVSYRGTDNLNFPFSSSNDIANGWINATGTTTQQAELALEFYQEVTGQSVFNNSTPLDTIVTGHSLGGGLAQIVSSLSGVTGYGFDWMPAGLAAAALAIVEDDAAIVDMSSFRGIWLENEILQSVRDGTIPDRLSNIFALFPERLNDFILDIVGVDTSQLEAIAERIGLAIGQSDPNNNASDAAALIADAIQKLEGEIPTTFSFDAVTGVSDGLLVIDRATKLHMMDFLVLQIFSDENQHQDWRFVGPELFGALFDPDVAAAAGFDKVDGTASDVNQLGRAIAYSALDTGERPFGDTGIRAFYDDADELGSVAALIDDPNTSTSGIAADQIANISKTITQFAGLLALNDVENEQGLAAEGEPLENVLQGVLDHSETEQTLTIDLSDKIWEPISRGVTPQSQIVGDLYATTGIDTVIRQATEILWGNDTVNAIDRIIFSVVEDGAIVLPDNPEAQPDQGTLFVGSAGADTVTGSLGNDLLLGFDGNDSFVGSLGSDIIVGGFGLDEANYALSAGGPLYINPLGLSEPGDVLIDVESVLGSVTESNEFIWGGGSHINVAGGAAEDKLTVDVPSVDADFSQFGTDGSVEISSSDGLAAVQVGSVETFAFSGDANLHLGSPSGVKAESNAAAGINFVTEKFFSSGGDLTVDYSSVSSALDIQLEGIKEGLGSNSPDLDSTVTLKSGGPSDTFANLQTIIGTNAGDTYRVATSKLELNGRVPLTTEIVSGSGNDVVEDGQPANYIYSGGDDILRPNNGRQSIGSSVSIIMPFDITADDIEIERFNERDGALLPDRIRQVFSYDLRVKVEGYGTITIEGYEGYFDNPGTPSEVEVVRFDPYGALRFIDGTEIRLYTESGMDGPDYQTAVDVQLDPNLYKGGVLDDFFTGRPSSDDTLIGYSGDDDLDGLSGDDELFGGSGSDALDGGSGGDLLDGGPGDDILRGQGGFDLLLGAGGNDLLVGGANEDTLAGGVGNDTLNGGDASDRYIYTAGIDTILDSGGDGDQIIFDPFYSPGQLDQADLTNGALVFEAGVDEVSFNGLAPSDIELFSFFAFQDLSFSGLLAGMFDLFRMDASQRGDRGDNTLRGTSGRDISYGYKGDDTLRTLAGDDILDGGDGFDRLEGGIGDDLYRPGSDVNTIFDAGGDADALEFVEGVGFTDLTLSRIAGPENVFNNLLIEDGRGNAVLVEGHYNVGSRPNAVETLLFSDDSTVDLIALEPGIAIKGNENGNTITLNKDGIVQDDLVTTFGGNDVVVAGDGNDTLEGGSGDDNLSGEAGDDVLRGGDDDDVLSGGEGNDELDGGAGNDLLNGGDDNDRYIYAGGIDVIQESGGDDTLEFLGGLVFSDLEFVENGSDLLIRTDDTDTNNIIVEDHFADDGSGTVENLKFSDDSSFDLTSLIEGQVIEGSFTADTLVGGAGNDTIFGVDGNNLIVGGAGNDSLRGGFGQDTLEGGPGDDILFGGFTDFQFRNLLRGGLGGDRYEFFSEAGFNIVDDAGGDNDILFISSFSPNFAEFRREGDNLIIGGFEPITILNHFTPEGKIETILARDGTTFDLCSLDLVDSLPPNNPPVALDDAFDGIEDTIISGNVLDDNGNGVDSDPDTDPLSVSPLTAFLTPQGGTLELLEDGRFTYTPADDFAGTDTFSYTLFDGEGGQDTGDVTLEVAAVNDAPVAQDDVINTLEDLAVTGDLLADNGNGVDFDPDGDALGVNPASFTTALGGQVAIAADGTFEYNPAENVAGQDSFTYTLNDGQGGTDTATATVNILRLNDAPLPENDVFTGNQGEVLEGNLLVDNGNGPDFDPDGDDLEVILQPITTAMDGSVVTAPDGTFFYTPADGFVGQDSFEYQVRDGKGGTAAASVSISVGASTNPPPVAVDDTASTGQGMFVDIDVLENDSDPDGEPISVISAGDGDDGTTEILPGGLVRYTPNPGFSGEDSFSYTISDGNGGTDIATATITVAGPPVLAIAPLNAAQPEGNSGTKAFTFEVTRVGDTSAPSRVEYFVAGPDTDADDFGGVLPDGVVDFAAGETSKTITVDVSGDLDLEPDEAFTVFLTNPVNGEVDPTADFAAGVIENDDAGILPPTISITPVSAIGPEGESGSTGFTFEVVRTGNLLDPSSVEFSVQPFETDADDFFGGAFPSGTVSFAPGEASKVITIDVQGDTDIETDEQFIVALSNAVNGTIDPVADSASGTIENDDFPGLPFLDIFPVSPSQEEGDSGTTPFVFQVVKRGDPDAEVSADISVTGGDVNADDFGGTLPFERIELGAGELTQDFVVDVTGDTDVEPDESFFVALSNIENAQGGIGPIEGIIINDDTEPPPPNKQICIDFETLADGTSLHAGDGLDGKLRFDGGLVIEAIRRQDLGGRRDDAMIFNAEAPTGGDDDLGVGGQGNIAIISEDGDASDPDDNAQGGIIFGRFDAPVTVDRLTLIDADEKNTTIHLLDEDGHILHRVSVSPMADGSKQVIELGDTAGVSEIRVNLQGSGAIDDLKFSVDADGIAPEITSPENASVDENERFVIDVEAIDDHDSEGNGLRYEFAGVSRDENLFSIDAHTGEVSFKEAPDFENPLDVGGVDEDNVYVVNVRVTDSDGLSDVQAFSFEVIDVDETSDDLIRLGIYDSNSNALISFIDDGDSFPLDHLKDREPTYAVTIPDGSPLDGQVESIFMNLNHGQFTRTENVEPYSILGDIDGHFLNGFDYPKAGEQSLHLDLYSEDNRGGTKLASLDVAFTITDDDMFLT